MPFSSIRRPPRAPRAPRDALGVDAILNELGLGMRMNYAVALYRDPSATLDDLREAVTTLEDTERIARRVFGGAHPLVAEMELTLQNARAALRTRETPPPSSPSGDV